MLFRKDWSVYRERPTRDYKEKSWWFAPTCHSRIYSTITCIRASSRSENVSVMNATDGSVQEDLLFMESCQHMTDRRFQEELSIPVEINREVSDERNYTGEEHNSWTWISCPHVSKGERA